MNALNISLDTLRPDRFEALARRGGHGRVLAAIEEAVRLGYNPVKVRGLHSSRRVVAVSINDIGCRAGVQQLGGCCR